MNAVTLRSSTVRRAGGVVVLALLLAGLYLYQRPPPPAAAPPEPPAERPVSGGAERLPAAAGPLGNAAETGAQSAQALPLLR